MDMYILLAQRTIIHLTILSYLLSSIRAPERSKPSSGERKGLSLELLRCILLLPSLRLSTHIHGLSLCMLYPWILLLSHSKPTSL